MAVTQIDGADNTRVQIHFLAIIGGVADYISYSLDCSQGIISDAVGKY